MSAVSIPQLADDRHPSASFKYRKDVDGLRAIAVVAVMAFHLGWAPAGYLGVDVFFVISGYLITGIIAGETTRSRFSFLDFYQRRIRRILPLAMTTSIVALAIGLFVMLPDDLENLAESVVATNLFSNNILQALTTMDYWDVVNEYKPLMHTWSLGIEEQFYVIWPAIVAAVFKLDSRWRLPTLYVVAAGSLALFFAPFESYLKFYYLPFRLFELAAGGLVAVAQQQALQRHRSAKFGLLVLAAVLVFGQALPNEVQVVFAVFATCLIMMTTPNAGGWYSAILENRLVVYLGLISFSLYMWHQVVYAFARYIFVEVLDGYPALSAVVVTLAISALSQKYIERPFRNRSRIPFSRVCAATGLLFMMGTLSGLWVYYQAGVVRDVPEMGLRAGDGERGLHAAFNDRINADNRDFASNKIRVLVIGNSFARDWANVLLSSPWRQETEISYSPSLLEAPNVLARARDADVIFWSEAPAEQVLRLDQRLAGRLYVVGTKNFGRSAGIFYNHRGADYFEQRVRPDAVWLKRNQELSRTYGDRYIDQMKAMMDDNGEVPVFTPDGKFISQDCRHLTSAGAAYTAEVLKTRLDEIFQDVGATKAPKEQ